MSSYVPHIYIFGKGKVNVRQLVIFNCRLTHADAAVEVSRVFREGEPNTFRLETSNMHAAISYGTKTLHLNDIFLSSEFGLSLKFKDEAEAFSSVKDQPAQEFMEITTTGGKEIRLVSFVEASPIK